MAKHGKQTFSFVYIPADPHEPIQELRQDYSEGEEGDEVECLLNRIKAHFANTRLPKTESQLAEQREQLLANVPEDQRGRLSDELLATACEISMVETIALLSHAPDNAFVGINLYCDDNAGVMHAPMNLRASELVQYCGQHLTVRGDAFLARVLDNGEDFKRLDFTMSDMSSSAQWVKDAFKQNEQKMMRKPAEETLMQMEHNKGGRPEPASSVTVRELSPGEAAKEDGNVAFKRGDFAEAVSCYSKALSLDHHLLVARNNRAMALLKLERYEEAEVDCDHVLLVEPQNVKALLRRATAREALKRVGEAVEDYREALEVQPNNPEAQAGVERLQAVEHDAISDSVDTTIPPTSQPMAV